MLSTSGQRRRQKTEVMMGGCQFAILKIILTVFLLHWVAGPLEARAEEQALLKTLSFEEKAWLDEHPLVRVGVDPEFHPFEFVDENGDYQGIASDYLVLLGERLGIRFEIVQGLGWEEAVERVRRREIDLLPAVGLTKERHQFLVYTESYVGFHRVVISRTDMPFLSGLKDIASLRVAVQKESSHQGFLLENTEIKPIVYPTLQDTLLAVSSGEADVMVGNVASAAYRIRKMNLTNLKVAAAASDEIHGIHFAVRKDWPELASILQKGILSIGDNKRDDISKKWVVLQFEPEVAYGPLLLVALGAVVVVLVILLWSWQLKRHRNEATKARDMAEAANQELRELSERLEELVEQRTLELRRTQEQFYQAQKLEALGTLVGGIAHDFNNILTGMLSAIELADEHVSSPYPSKFLRTASEIGYRGADMISQLLAFARQEQVGKSPLQIKHLVESLRALAGPAVDKSIKLDFNLEGANLWIHGNLALLQQVLLNLLTNARDAVCNAESPRVSLRVYPTRPEAALLEHHSELSDQDYVAFEVTDNGIGIEREKLNKLFDPFYTTKAPGKGTGLGLPMVYGAVQDHQGAVWVDSELGRGSTFYVLLPQHEKRSKEKDEETGETVPGAGETVLLAEDDVTIQELHRLHLEQIGYDVITASDGTEAIERFKENAGAIDIALLDVVMPGRDGVAVAKAIRDQNPEIPVLFLTGYEAGHATRWAKEQPRADVLKKPISIKGLSQALSEYLKKQTHSK